MNAQQVLFLAENGSYRVNLLYLGGFFIFYNSWTASESMIGFIFYLIYYAICELLIALLALGIFCAALFSYSQMDGGAQSVDTGKLFRIKNSELDREFKNRKMPMETWIEAYFAGEIDLGEGVDMHDDILIHRKKYFRFNFTKGHLRFFLQKFLVQITNHSKLWDFNDVSTTYNIGNDFYQSFLGDAMVYTSAIFDNDDESLEDAQTNKMNLVGQKIKLKAGEDHLDIGCGWGTFVIHCAREFGTNSMGITIAQEQINFGKDRSKESTRWSAQSDDALNRINLQFMDYRDLPRDRKWDKITALEMAEHVGVKNYKAFLKQIYSMLKDDGMFYIQVCGLRPSWQFEDFVWGLFMGKYIFPAADASCPSSWVMGQLEQAGFEIHSYENVSIHYVKTIYLWYRNFMNNYDTMKEIYGEKLCRIWVVFLAWSTLIGSEGSSACFQFVCHKNLPEYNRRQWLGNDAANYILRNFYPK
jgi:cyclopropane fatty-acyl-phospholipid synthase-like methyltransferase